MSKKLLVTDTHLGIYQASDIWHEITLDLFKELRDECVRNDIRQIIHLGDFFHDRKSLNTKAQKYAHKICLLFEDSGIEMYIVVGNHDCYYKNKIHPHSLEFMKMYNSICIVDEPIIVDNICLCPWGSMPIEGPEYVMGHFQFSGFLMNNSYRCKNGFNPNDESWSRYRKIFSGHFHTPSEEKNIIYIGSAFQQNFNDVGSKRGYYIFSDGLKFTQYHHAPEFIKIDAGTDIDKYNIEGNIIRLIFTENYGKIENEHIIESLKQRNPLQFDIDFSVAASKEVENGQDEVESAPTLLDHREIIENYLNSVAKLPKNLNKNVVLQMIENLRGK